MGDSTTTRNLPEELERQTEASTHSPADAIATLAALGANAVAAERCAVAWSANGREQIIWVPDRDSRWDHVVVTVLSALDNRLSDAAAVEADRSRDSASASLTKILLTARELASFAAGTKPFQEGVQFVASALHDGQNAVRIVLVAATDRARIELEVILELIGVSALAEISRAASVATLDFWRAHASRSAAHANEARKALQHEREQSRTLESVIATASQFPAHERFSRLGALVADYAGYEHWIVAIAEDGVLKIMAASDSNPRIETANPPTALAKSFHAREVIEFTDDLFPGRYICIPFDGGVIALASNRGKAGARDRAEALIARLAPIVKCWALEDQGSRRRALVDRLALRMYAAIDEERARIARDMHDDQAQLLTAAKIALEGKPEQARAILKQIEEELRRKTRELSPPSLGDATLDDALEREFARLRDAGVVARLRKSDASKLISRSTQQLCFQVAREAFSNVIKHARATSVEVSIKSDRATRIARISIADNGNGIASHSPHAGIGLTGLRERLELVGGSLSVESKPTGTTVTAQIPELSETSGIE